MPELSFSELFLSLLLCFVFSPSFKSVWRRIQTPAKITKMKLFAKRVNNVQHLQFSNSSSCKDNKEFYKKSGNLRKVALIFTLISEHFSEQLKAKFIMDARS